MVFLVHSRLRACLAVLPALSAILCGGATTVKVVNRQLLVDGKPLHLKGVCWNPVPKGGIHPKDLDFRGFVESDSELMARAGINAVRTYDAIVDREVLDVLWKRKIYVLNTVYIYGKDPLDLINKRVNSVKDHPAILMWVVGNEWNYNGLYIGLPYEQALQRVKDAVRLIKQLDATHPVSTVHGELPNGNTLRDLAEVDVWGINKYSGISFGDLFDAWRGLSQGPMYLGEYGADAYNTKASHLDEQAQALATKVLTGQIVDASSVKPGGVCVGGIIFEFADEWWKDSSGNPAVHDVGGVSPGGGPYPDMTFNEEWWGLVKYDGTPREAFKAYAAIAIPGAAPTTQALIASNLQAVPRHPRMAACGVTRSCRTKLGNCCPSRSGEYDTCCNTTASTSPAPTLDLPSTTWLPPAPHKFDSTAGGQHANHAYREFHSKFANGRFKAGTNGCNGVGECQFETRTEAQAFCDAQPKCSAVLLHPFEDGCAGGWGCYTPRFGSISSNSLWDRSGGKAWIRGDRIEGGKPATQPQAGAVQPTSGKRYIFVGFAIATQAQAACQPYGKVAMPKTDSQQRALMAAIDAAQAAGKMSRKWPKNTIWLGAYWDGKTKQWGWNDGTLITEFNWASGQPSASAHQATEPWLCMVLNGQMHDSDPPWKFGIFCEDEADGGKGPSSDSAEDQPVTTASTSLPKLTPSTTPSTTTSAPPPPPTTPAPTVTNPKSITMTPKQHGNYEFVGFAGPEEARHACGSNNRLAMPKTEAQQRQLQQAIADALADHDMSSTWPQNTIWIGASWNPVSKRWEWDDGTTIGEVRWASGQPSSSANQTHEPFLCMVADGHVHDSDPPYSFGVMCEKGTLSSTRSRPISTTTPQPPPPAAAKRLSPSASDGNLRFSYTFLGFATAQEARSKCAQSGHHLAMPKTELEQSDLSDAVDKLFKSGEMSGKWPNNTLWLGGRWNSATNRWEWDDSTEITHAPWAPGQPSAAQQQEKEPWLCMQMQSGGKVHDSDAPWSFGVMCQQEAARAGKRVVLRKMRDSKPAASRSMLGVPTSERHPVTWVKGTIRASCNEACQSVGGCVEEDWAWPQSAADFQALVLPRTSHACQVREGGYPYDPSASGSDCRWRGSRDLAASAIARCASQAPQRTSRFCPCHGAPQVWT